MKDRKKLSLNEEINREAEQIEKEIMSRTDLDDIKFSEDAETSLFNKIQEYEFDKREKKVYHRKKKKYFIFALAAVLVLAFGSVMTGVGSKSYWKVLWDRAVGNENVGLINVEDMEIRETFDVNEINAFREIDNVFGINTVRLIYKPKDMALEKYSIDTEQRRAFLYYRYGKEIIRYTIYLNDDDSSLGQNELDTLSNVYEISVDNDIQIKIEEYDVENLNNKRYIAEFKYKDVHYQLMGTIEKTELEKILKECQFL